MASFSSLFPPDSEESLAQRIQDLTPELYNRILEYTLTIDQDDYTFIDTIYRPPAQLQVSSATRAHYAESYYAESHFLVSRPQDLRNWLSSLSWQYPVSSITFSQHLQYPHQLVATWDGAQPWKWLSRWFARYKSFCETRAVLRDVQLISESIVIGGGALIEHGGVRVPVARVNRCGETLAVWYAMEEVLSADMERDMIRNNPVDICSHGVGIDTHDWYLLPDWEF